MYLKQLEINNFRNYDSISLRLTPNINIFYGNNAQGKTNLLEAIYFLGLSKSHRCSNMDSLIKNGSSISNISGMLEMNDSTINLFVGFDKEKKNLKINNQPVNKVKDYVSNMNIIIFSPNDLDLIKGNPEIRRKYLNTEISQISSSYMKILDEYNKLLKMRNDYLSATNVYFDKVYFEILTSYLVERAISIYKYRRNYIDKINKLVPDIFYKISSFSGFFIKYVNSIDIDYNSENVRTEILKKYEEIFEEEKKMGKTLIGPHRDDFEFFLKDKNLKLYGSQGQQRISIIVLKLAEIHVFNQIKNSTPIILLDDVFSELDDQKKNNLLKYIDNSAQVIITTTDLNNIDEEVIKHANVMKICNGNLEEVRDNGTK